MSTLTPLIVAQGLGVTVDSTPLLHPVSFAVQSGQCVAVTGANGAGKTTLLRVIAGLTKNFVGSLTVQGRAVDNKDPQYRALVAAQIGISPLAANLTLLEHLTLVGASWGQSVPEAELHALDILGRLDLKQLSHRYVHEISSGQTQLFSFALTLSREFEILVLDEPEQRLDSHRLGLVVSALQRLKDSGVTIILATHSQELVSRIADWELSVPESVHDASG